jgi:FtsP/CotA-like multicopper oxidase with cupredoxin domain
VLSIFSKFLCSSLLLLVVVSSLAQAPETTFDLAIVDGKVAKEKRLIKVHKGDLVRLRLTSNLPGDVHLHAFRLQAKVSADKPSELTFRAHATGKFRFEWHETKQQGKVPAEGGHHAEPLATLEVRPN